MDDQDEKQMAKQLIMRLKLLDLRDNRLQSIFLKDAVNFLRETVVLMWDNPFTEDQFQIASDEFRSPAHLFRASEEFDDDYTKIRNPIHIFKPLSDTSPLLSLIEDL